MKKKLIIISFCILAIAGCKKWEDHIQVNNQDLTHDLLETIAANPNLSKFREYIATAGLDSVLKSSKSYTVWAPNNAALATIDPAIVNDVTKLRSFVMNHIADLTWFTRDAKTAIRVKMLNNKYNNFFNTTFDVANITTADKFVKNGVLHEIDKFVAVLPNIWDFINSTTAIYAQNKYITTLNFTAFDSTLAVVDSISSTTGQPIYHPGTGIVQRNRFNDKVYDTKREDKVYTYFVITDASFTVEADSLKNYYKAATPAITDSLTRWNTIKDLIVEGAYPATALTGLVSKYGIALPLINANIVQTVKLSNGIAYVFSQLDIPTGNKFPTLLVQGESPSGFLVDRPGNTNYRIRANPVTGQIFYDLLVSGHGVTSYYAYYRLNEIPSVKYRVYGFGINDFQTGAVSQNIVVKSFSPPSTYTQLANYTHAVPLSTAANAYNELFFGEFTPTAYGTLEIQLTASGTGPIVLDYLRLVPVP